jgi:hypothetical protein
MSYDPEPGYDYDGQRDPDTTPDPEFADLAWPEIVRRLDAIQEYADRQREEEFLMNVWLEQWYEENPGERDY